MNMAEHERFPQYNQSTIISYFSIDGRCNRLLALTLLSFKRCVLVNQL